MNSILRLEHVDAYYRAAHVLHDVSLEFHGASLAVVGRNGMGKSTLCNAIMGLVPRVDGIIQFQTQNLVRLRPNAIAKAGIGYVPQGRRIFPSLTTEEHLRLTLSRGRAGRWDLNAVYELFPPLAARRKSGGGQLSGGEQQMLAIARVLLLNPTLLILDEPSEGLAPTMVDQVVNVLQRLQTEGVAILLIEQNLGVASAIASDVAVMVNGEVAHIGPIDELVRDSEAQHRLLGV